MSGVEVRSVYKRNFMRKVLGIFMFLDFFICLDIYLYGLIELNDCTDLFDLNAWSQME